MELSLRFCLVSLLLLVLLVVFGCYALEKYLLHLVSFRRAPIKSYPQKECLFLYIQTYSVSDANLTTFPQADADLSEKNGCQLPPELPKRWPLGLDRLKQLWDSNAEGRLLAFLCTVAENYEPRNNLYQFLLVGPRAFHILHPSNVQTLLSTNFKGMALYGIK